MSSGLRVWEETRTVCVCVCVCVCAQSDVFKSKIACCSVLTATGVWNQLTTRAQGICAVPDNTYSCYIPNTGERCEPCALTHTHTRALMLSCLCTPALS